MRNPYEVLEIKEGASFEEIKKAYRNMVKKYHPDKYKDNPLADLAEEKMREINEAYEHLSQTHGQGTGGGSYENFSGSSHGNSSGSSYSGEYGSSQDQNVFNQVRILINQNRIEQAEAMLNSSAVRNAQWYYLMGMVYVRKGWYNQARTNFQMAADMDPGNMEYRQAINQMNNAGNTYSETAYNRGRGSDECGLCELCQCLLCADCCCNCMGGGC